MNKKCLFLILVLVVQTKSDCSDDFLKCFTDFADSFFQNITEVEHVNISESIPDFKHVKDVELKTIEELTQSIQEELFKQLQSQIANDAVVATDNSKTKIYVKTFSHYFEDGFLPDFENINSESDEIQPEKVENQEFTSVFEENSNNDSETFSILNQFPENVTYLNEYNEEDLKETSEDVKEEKNDNITSTEEQSTIIYDISTISAETDKNIDEKEQKSIDNKENRKQEQETTSYNETQKVREEEMAQIDLTDKQSNKNNNITSNSKEQKPSEIRSLTNTEKQFEKDIRENIIQIDDKDYDIEDATDYPQIDYIDLYKDTTNEENVYVPTDSPISDNDINEDIVENVEEYSLEIETGDNDTSTNICHGNTSDVSNIFPWIATIFIKNNTANNQYQYICDGALLGDKLLITAARCFIFNNSTVTTDNVLVFLGKRSLQTVGEDERTVLVSQIKIHPNFTNEDDVTSNDLALLVLEEPVMFSDSIRPACLGGDGFVGKTATTAWDITGALKPLLFLNNKKEDCNKPNDGNGTFCDTYGNTVALCPSHGGLHASKRASRWYLDGIRSGDPQDRGLCYDKTVKYTSLTDHLDWIMDNME